MSTIIPNTFQCHNVYVDRAMELLTDPEFKVLIYFTRHILGWQSSIDERKGYLSLSMLEHGYTDSYDNYYGGCGLSRGTLISVTSSLAEFGFIVRIGKATPRGQKWKLADRGIQWEKLEQRRKEQLTKNKAKTVKATAASLERRLVTSDDTSNVERNQSGTSDVTSPGTSDVPKQNHTKSHVKNHSAPNGAARPIDPIYDAVKETIFGIDDPAVVAGGRIGKISNWLKGKYQGAKGKEVGLISAPAKVEHIASFAKWYTRQYPDVRLPRDFEKFVEHWREWASSASKPAAKPHTMSPAEPEPETPKRRISAADLERMGE